MLRIPNSVTIAVYVLACGALPLAANTDARVSEAAMRGDRDEVRSLLAQKADVNGKQGDGTTALHWAAYRNDLEMTRTLLRAGADVKAETEVGALTPLFIACGSGDGALIQELLKTGADANASNRINGTTALMKAAGAGSAEAVRVLLDHGAKVNAKESAHGQTALMFAAGGNSAPVIKLLAAHGAELKATSKVTEVQPIRPTKEEADYPLDAEVILNNNLPPGEKAAAAALAGRRATASVMGGLAPLMFAARDNHLEAVRSLLDAGADINQQSAGDQSTALVLAVNNGHYDLAKLLVERGANPNVANADGLTPLYAAIDTQWAPLGGTANAVTAQEQTTYLELMKTLLEHGANPDAQLKRKLWYRPTAHDQMWVGTPGSTAFWRAAQATDLEAMRLLIAHHANPKIASDEGDTALMMAAGVGWAGNFSRNAPTPPLEAVRYCIELGLDVNTQDETGYTALGGAAWRGDNESVKLLVEKGAKVNARTARGWSVTDMADGPSLRTTVPFPHPDTVALLIGLGAPRLTPHPGDAILGLTKGPVPVPQQDRQ